MGDDGIAAVVRPNFRLEIQAIAKFLPYENDD